MSLTNDDQGPLQLQTAFIWQTLRETASLTLKAVSFFLGIMAAILGYLLYRPLDPPLRQTAFWIVGSVALLFIVAVGAIAWGLFTGLRDLEEAHERLSLSGVSVFRLSHYFRRAYVVFWIVISASLVMIAVLLVGIGLVLRAA